MEIQGIIRDYFENIYPNKFENLEEMDKFLDTYDHPKLNQEDINHIKISITQNEIEAAIKSLPKNKTPGTIGFFAEFYQTFREELIPTLLKLFYEMEREKKHCLTHFMEPVLHLSQNQTKTPLRRRTIGQSLL
jgi:hypothetical protein